MLRGEECGLELVDFVLPDEGDCEASDEEDLHDDAEDDEGLVDLRVLEERLLHSSPDRLDAEDEETQLQDEQSEGVVVEGGVEEEGEGVEAGDDLGREEGTSRNSMDQKKDAQHSSRIIRIRK